MKKWLFLNVILAVTLILGACSTSNNVVSNKLISKRKYEKGFHINSKSNLKTQNDELAEEKLVDDKGEVEKSNDGLVKSKKIRFDKGNNEINSNLVVENNEVEAIEVQAPKNKSYGTDNAEVELNEMSTDAVSISKNQNNANESEANSVEQQTRGLDTGDPLILILLVILAIVLPPLAVFLFEGASKRFIIDLILFILGWGAFGLFHGIFWICGLVSVIYALLIVLSVI